MPNSRLCSMIIMHTIGWCTSFLVICERKYDTRQDKQFPLTSLVTGNSVCIRKIQFRKVPYSIRRIHAPNTTAVSALVLPVGLQDRIPASPAESDCPNLIRAGCHAHCIDEAVDQGAGHTFAVCDEPWAQRGRHNGGVLGFVDHAQRFLRLEGGLDIIQKGYRQGVALVKVRHVGVESRLGILVGEEADVGEFVAKDLKTGVLATFNRAGDDRSVDRGSIDGRRG